MDRIAGISGIAAGPGGTASAHVLPVPSTARSAAIAHPLQATADRPEPEPSDSAAGQVRPGAIGSDGRFEKLILAVQALQLVYGFDEQATGPNVREMREAAQEIFRIDGVPAPIEPAGAAPPKTDLRAEAMPGAESSPMPCAAPVEAAPVEARPVEAGPVSTRPSLAALSQAQGAQLSQG
jgi:hypothetical protein